MKGSLLPEWSINKSLVVIMMDFPNTQEIRGIYWLRIDTIRPENTYVYHYSEVEILRVTKDSIFFNDFDKTIEVAPILEKEEYVKRNMARPEFVALNRNLLLKKLTFRNQDEELTTFEDIHVRLIPTKISNKTVLDRVAYSTYEGVINGFHNILEFKDNIRIDSIPQITDNDILGDGLKLENFKEFFFLSFYLKGKRFRVIPISEISDKTITVYGYNAKQEFSTLKKRN